MTRRIGAFLTLAVLLAAGSVIAILGYGRLVTNRPFQGYASEEAFFAVHQGDNDATIARNLEAAGIIQNARVFLAAIWLCNEGGRLEAGEYHFRGPATVLEVIDRLVAGDVFYRTITVPEGLTMGETAALLSSKGLGPVESFLAVFGDGSLAAEFDPKAEDLEGYLFPDTYRLPRNPSSYEVARAMVARFVDVFDASRRDRARAVNLSIREVVTLASVVEKETGQAAERPLIASVFWNRLRKSIPLQSDPTVIYGLKRQGNYDGNLSRAHLKMRTSYNTYVNRGLPPGPIASPGREAIDAVLSPADTHYLYFVSRNDGSHQFSVSLKEHNSAVRKYQVEYFRKKRHRRGKQAPG